MITLSDNIFASLAIPLDSRMSNVIIDGSNIVIETESEYLERVDIDSRYAGMEVFFISPSGTYTITYFTNAIQSGTITSVKYKFNSSTSDDDFEVYSEGSSSSGGHIIKDDSQSYTDQPYLTFKGSGVTVTNNSDDESTDIEIDEPSTTEDITSFGVGDVGGITEGTTISSGTTFNDFVKQLLQTLTDPTAPVAGLTLTPSSIQEIGSTIDIMLTPSFTQNDAGEYNTVVFEKDDTTLQTQTTLSSYTASDITIVSGSNTFIVYISYDAGEEDSTLNGIIDAGTVSATKSVTGAYKSFYGPYGSSDPTTGTELRTTLSSSYSYTNPFTLNTGTTATKFVIAVPSSKTLSSIIDTSALNADLTDSYELSTTVTAVPDAGGTYSSYNVYILTIAEAYSSSHAHVVTLT